MNIPICPDGLSWLLDPWIRDIRRQARNRRKRAKRDARAKR